MPSSKARKKPQRRQRTVRTATLETSTLAVLKASLALVQEAEVMIRQGDAAGAPVDELLGIHLDLRAATLGLMVAYSSMTGMPDPRGPEIAGKVLPR